MAGESRGEIVNGSPPLPFDTSVAHVARVYNYWLGGKDNFAADRAAGEQAIKAFPEIGLSARSNRGFLARAVRFLAGPESSWVTGQILVAAGGFVGSFDRPAPRVLGYRDHHGAGPWSIEDLHGMLCTRSPSRWRRRPGSSTWTTTRSCSTTLARC